MTSPTGDGASPQHRTRSLHAFLDESQSHRSYMLAAGIAHVSSVPAARQAMAGLILKRQRKVHWRDESTRRRLQIMRVVMTLPLSHVVVVRAGQSAQRGERQRRQCLERMLYELDQLGIAEATFESRGASDDARDRHMLDALRSRKVISAELRIGHTAGPLDPLLWVPDAVCGAVTQHRTGEPQYLELLSGSIHVIDIEPD